MQYLRTTAQAAHIYTLLRRCELDCNTLSLMHQPGIRSAGMSFIGWNGEPVASFVGQLTAGQASAYIGALARQAGDA
ncbi:MAG: hypothetical protein JSR26_04075 [Proteobacteria bacterium]|nr:hypothetical protein [Pseudomonadota bacterium]